MEGPSRRGVFEEDAVEVNGHPKWYKPKGEGNKPRFPLKFRNSLTGQLEEFVPGEGNKVLWYTCGPTVYDSAHLGHARAYLTFDIIRRIMEDYFGYDVLYQVNVTDIDDKIIKRARRNKLLNSYRTSGISLDQMIGDASQDMRNHVESMQGKLNELQAEAAAAAAAPTIGNKEKREHQENVDAQQKALQVAKRCQEIVGEIQTIRNTASSAASGGDDTESEPECVERLLSYLGTSRTVDAATANSTTAEEDFDPVGVDVQEAVAKAAVGDKLRSALFAVAGDAMFARLDEADKELDNLAATQSQGQGQGQEKGQGQKSQGSAITQADILEHARYYEREFMEDMKLLGIRDPDVLTRVTEYVPQIITFIQEIIDKELAYCSSSGSVYLDLVNFRKHYDYRKNSPSPPTNDSSHQETTDAELAESEGELSGAADGEKRNMSDFVLWKASRPGEPSWESPWGPGRPGWHIECSVVASDILGPNLDIHSGGIDLMFPHHDNELAQSEACFETQQWVNYFTHAGHLHIQGLKMSKSLKNFITIREALKTCTARQLRILFLLNKWDESLTYSAAFAQEAITKEGTLVQFFGKVNDLLRSDYLSKPVGWRVEGGKKDKELSDKLLATQQTVREALCDNFNTPTAMSAILGLVSDFNTYVRNDKSQEVSPLLAGRIARYINKMLKVFGVVQGNDDTEFVVLSQDDQGTIAEGGGGSTKWIDLMVRFRSQVRNIALQNPKNNELSQILDACDELRDVSLPKMGIDLQDRKGQDALWLLRDPDQLMAEIKEKNDLVAAKKAEEEARKKKKLEARIEKLKADIEKYSKIPEDLTDLFKKLPEYSDFKADQFDDLGIPTKTKDGEDLAKSARKKLIKYYNQGQKLHAEMIAKSGSVSAFVDSLRSQLQELERTEQEQEQEQEQERKEQQSTPTFNGKDPSYSGAKRSEEHMELPPTRGIFYVRGDAFSTGIQRLHGQRFESLEAYSTFMN